MIQEVFDRGSYELSLSAVPLLLISMLGLLLSARTLFTEGFKRISFALFLLFSSVAIWLVSFFWMYSSVNERVALWWAKASYLGVPFISSTIYYFTVLAIRKYERKKGLVRLSFVLSLLTSVVIIGTDTVISGVRHFSWGYYPQYTRWSIVYIVFFFGFIGLSIHQLRIEYHRSQPESTERRRIKAFLAAITIASVGGVDYLAKFGLPVYPFGYLAVFTGILIIERTLSLYRLVNITPRFAAESIISTMNESLIVLDAESVIRLVKHSSASLLGGSLPDQV